MALASSLKLLLLVPLVARVVTSLPQFCEQRSNPLELGAPSPDSTDQVRVNVPPEWNWPEIWDGCTEDQTATINNAFDQFALLARGTWKWYEARTKGGTDVIRDAADKTHLYWFGDQSKVDEKYEGWNKIIVEQVYKNAVNGKNDKVGQFPVSLAAAPQFQCASNGKRIGECKKTVLEKWYAYTSHEVANITLCPLFFDQKGWFDWKQLRDNKKTGFAAGTIAHEMTHSRVLIGVTTPKNEQPFTTDNDNTYGWDSCHSLAKNPSKAVTNADNYDYYFQQSFYQYCQCSDHEGTRQDANPEKEYICRPFWNAVTEDKDKGSCAIL